MSDIIKFPLNLGFTNRVDDISVVVPLNEESVNLRTALTDEDVSKRMPYINPTALLPFSASYVTQATALACNTGDLLVYTTPAQGPYVVSPQRVKRYNSQFVDDSVLANAWMPLQVDRSEMVLGGTSQNNFAVATMLSGHRVTVGYQDNRWRLVIQVDDAYGNTIFGPTEYDAGGADPRCPISLTTHGDRVCIWYYNAGVITMRRVEYSAGAVGVLGPYSVKTPSAPLPFAAAICANYETTLVYLLAPSSIASTAYNLSIRNTANGAEYTSVEFPAEVSGTAYNPVALNVHQYGGTLYIPASWINSIGQVRSITKTSAAGSSAFGSDHFTLSTIDATATYKDVIGVGCIRIGTTIRPLHILSDVTTGVVPSTRCYVQGLLSASIPAARLCGTVKQWNYGDTTVPVFPISRNFGLLDANVPTSTKYVPDTSIELYAAQALFADAASTVGVAPIARFGVDEAHISGSLPLCNLDIRADSYNFAYATYDARSESSLGASLRKVSGPMLGHFTESSWCGPARSVDLLGSSLICAAQPAIWDGRDLYEAGFLHMPYVTGSNSGGSSTTTGQFSVMAVYTYRSRDGDLVRSSPSLPITLNPSASAPTITVAKPMTIRAGVYQPEYKVELYATAITGSVFYLLPETNQRSTSAERFHVFSNVAPGTAPYPEIYTDGGYGSELPAEAPPALWDAVVSNARIFAIDAVKRNRIVYTKRKVAGIAYEWNGALEVLLDASAGEAVGLAELDGYVAIFAENGVYVISGDGPDSGGGGQGFSPQLVSLARVRKNTRNLITKTARGILFESTRGLNLMGSGFQLQPIDSLERPTGVRLSSMGFRSADDVVINTADSTTVIDLKNGSCQSWEPSAINAFQTLVYNPTDFKNISGVSEGFYVTTDMGVFVSTSSLSQATLDPWRIVTGWVVPGDYQSQVNFHEYTFTFRKTDVSGSLTIAECYDWTDVDDNETTFSAAQIEDAATVGSRLVYLRVKPSKPTAQAVKFRIFEGNPGSLIPIDFRVDVTVGPGVSRRYSTKTT